MVNDDEVAFDHRAEQELRRYTRRAGELVIGGSLTLLLSISVLPAIDFSLFERLIGAFGGVELAVLGTGIGSLLRGREVRRILQGTSWHGHACEFRPPRSLEGARVTVHGQGIFELPVATIQSRVRKGGLASAAHVAVANVGERAVLRVPGHDSLFLAHCS